MANGDENTRDYNAEIAGARETIDLTKVLIGLDKNRSTVLGASLEFQRNLIDALEEQAAIDEKIIDGTFKIEDAKKQQIISEGILKNLLREQDILTEALGTANSGIGEEIQKQIERAEELNRVRQKGVDDIDKSGNVATATFGFLESSAGVLQKALRLPEGFTEGISKAAVASRKAALAGKGFQGSIMAAFRAIRINPIGLLVTGVLALVKALLNANNKITALAKGLGVSKNEARAINERINQTAVSANVLGVNIKDVGRAFADINDFLGTSSTIISGELLVGIATIQNRLGLTKESAMGFAQASLLAGRNVNLLKNEAIGAALAAERERGTRVDIREVLEETGKISGLIRAQLGGNPAAIAKAVAQAKLLGLELSKVAEAGKQLLNFEQSISNELEAELLTGRQINLERARLAALTGDFETLTREINKNVGDFSDFTQLNVIQQEAIARAVGMEADALADVLAKKQNIEQLAQEARRAGQEDLARNLEQLSTQQKFNAAIEKLKDLVVLIVDKLESGTGIIGTFFGSDSAISVFQQQQRQVGGGGAVQPAEVKIDENALANALAGVSINVTTQYDGFKASNNTAYNAPAQRNAKSSTGFA